MNVLVDFHHKALFLSLYKLFVERLGWNLYVPMGIDWFDEKYWNLRHFVSQEDAKAIAKQYLQTPELKVFSLQAEPHPLVRYAYLSDIKNGTLKFDIIVASIPYHHEMFWKLNEDMQMGAKLILQAGNNWTDDLPPMSKVKNLLSSATVPYTLLNCPNKVFYHQEFDLEVFSKKTTCNIQSVSNFQHIMSDPDLFLALEKELPGWDFKSYGICNRDGTIAPLTAVAKATQNVGFIFHVKRIDEGYGHIIHNAFACGTPILTDVSAMIGQYPSNRVISNTATMLFTPETVIDVKGKTPSQLADELKRWSDEYWIHSESVYKKFTEVVDFDRDFENIKKFLERLI